MIRRTNQQAVNQSWRKQVEVAYKDIQCVKPQHEYQNTG